MTDTKKYFRTDSAAEYIVCAKSTLEKKRVTGDGPPFLKVGRVVLYDRDDLDAWLSSKRRTSTSDAGSEGA